MMLLKRFNHAKEITKARSIFESKINDEIVCCLCGGIWPYCTSRFRDLSPPSFENHRLPKKFKSSNLSIDFSLIRFMESFAISKKSLHCTDAKDNVIISHNLSSKSTQLRAHIEVFRSRQNEVDCWLLRTYLRYRVSHIEMVETKWLKGVVELRILMNYGVYGLQEVWTFVFHQPVFKKVT